MAHILWFSKFSNLIGESEISASITELSSLLNDYGEDRIKKIKQDAAKHMHKFQDMKADKPTAEADHAFTSSFSSILRFTGGLLLHFSSVTYGQRETGQTSPVNFLQKYHLYLFRSIQDDSYCHILGDGHFSPETPSSSCFSFCESTCIPTSSHLSKV